MTLTSGDLNVISNLRSQFGDKLKDFNDETIATAWRHYSMSDEYLRRNEEPDLFIDWCTFEF